jgi:ABC-type multidrug transport system fused ATPase/permease subunit
VTLRYADGGPAALDDVTLSIPAHGHTAIVGPSGAGKTSLFSLLLRFLDPDGGRIGLDGLDYRRLAADTVRERIGLVDDDPYVFASTVVENVRLARPDSSDDQFEAALRRAHLGLWLDGLPRGLHTHLGAAAVSGGERARLAIARSLLADQPVLVLDEPTAHLDSATAAEVADEILAEQGRSIVWITHSEIGLDRVDRVIAMPSEPAR